MTDNKKNENLMQQVDSQFRRTYSPTYAWADAVSAFSTIPALRGFWPMSSMDSAGNILDHSNLGKTLAPVGTPTLTYSGLVPFINFAGAIDLLWRGDEADLDILGNEGAVASSKRGMTVGGWFYFDGLGSTDICISKDDNAAQRSFVLVKSALNVITMNINIGIAVGVNTVSAATWYFLVGRFDPSTELALFTDDIKETNVVGIPATINNSTASFVIAANSAGSFALDGRATLCFYSAAYLSDSYILSLYHISRALFGK